MSQYQSIPKFISGAMRNKFRNTIVYRNLFWSIWSYGKRCNGSMFVYIGGDSSPASAHGSPLKRTRAESVSTDLHALSRGFIPGGIVTMSGLETRFDVSRGFIPGGIVTMSGMETRPTSFFPPPRGGG